MKRKVREVWSSEVLSGNCDGGTHPSIFVFLSKKFKEGDIVRVTVERVERKRGGEGK